MTKSIICLAPVLKIELIPDNANGGDMRSLKGGPLAMGPMIISFLIVFAARVEARIFSLQGNAAGPSAASLTPEEQKNEDQLEAKISRQIDGLLSKMTVEEKVGQMTQITLDVIMDASTLTEDEPRLDEEKLLDVLLKYHVGSILNVAGDKAHSLAYWDKILNKIKLVAKEDRLKIPVLYGIDSIHGANYTLGATLFPQSLAMASSWSLEASKRSGEITALETRQTGIPWNFFPVLDVGRQPLWPRLYETYGEDIYLAQEMGRANIMGQQGRLKSELSQPHRVLACMKHYVGYSFPWTGKDRTPAIITEKMMREIFLPTFESAIQAGAETLMVNSGEVDGIPGHANHHLLTDVLKGELKFKGFVVSDWEDIKRLHTRDHLAASPEEAVQIAVMAGVDMSMVPFDVTFADILTKLVKEKKVPMSRIDEAVRRILRVKFLAGLFDESTAEKKEQPNLGTPETRAESQAMAAETIILLKNKDRFLPLRKELNGSVMRAPTSDLDSSAVATPLTPATQTQNQTPNQALTEMPTTIAPASLQDSAKSALQVQPAAPLKVTSVGPTCQSLSALNGGWTITWQGSAEERYPQERLTLAEALEAEFGKDQVRSFKGTNYVNKEPDYEEAIKAAKESDLVVLCLGEKTYTETPGNINDLDLEAVQVQLAKDLYQTGKPVVLVLLQGRPRVIREIVDGAQAIVLSFLPGMEGAKAIVDTLVGRNNPSAKLPVTYPRYSNSLMTYDHKWQEVKEGNVFDPQWPFGFGLSYSEFAYKNIQISDKTIEASEKIHVEVSVENKSDLEGQEVVQVYISDLYRSRSTPPVKRLVAFKKVTIKPRSEVRVDFDIPLERLTFIDNDMKKVLESGEFRIDIGGLQESFSLQ